MWTELLGNINTLNYKRKDGRKKNILSSAFKFKKYFGKKISNMTLNKILRYIYIYGKTETKSDNMIMYKYEKQSSMNYFIFYQR